jgi:hypothetical protein
MTECGFIDESEFEKVAAEATAHMKGTEPERLMCIYTIHSFCNGCGDCADDLQGADLG